jgi:hypothetical protein
MALNRRADLTGRYEGFKGKFESGVFVFESMEERDRWQIHHYGRVRNAWREADDPTDDRPLIAHAPFWDSESERLEFEHAVETHPPGPGVHGNEYLVAYAARIADVVEGRLVAAGKVMPHPLGKAAHQRRLNMLEGQRAVMLGPNDPIGG